MRWDKKDINVSVMVSSFTIPVRVLESVGQIVTLEYLPSYDPNGFIFGVDDC